MGSSYIDLEVSFFLVQYMCAEKILARVGWVAGSTENITNSDPAIAGVGTGSKLGNKQDWVAFIELSFS